MNKDLIVDASLAKLNELLAAQFHTDQSDFSSNAHAAASRLPDDLVQPLAGLVETQARLKAAPAVDTEHFVEFAFRCGQVYEQLKAYRQIEMEMENVRMVSGSVEAAQLQASQIEPLARFIEARDRLFRKVADFTLKALLVLLALLTLGLVLGLV